MSAAPGVYVPLDVNYLRDPKVRKAGPEAEVLYVRSLAYAKGGGTDGMVYDYDLDVISIGLTKVQQRVNALVAEHLWERRDNGWFIVGWFKWNKSNEQLAEAKRRRAVGAAKTNHQRHLDKGEPFWRTCLVCIGEVEE